jgi:hypothetical protein
MTDEEWSALTVRLHAEAKAKAKHDAKLKRAGYSTTSWRPQDAKRKARGMAAQVEE